jgi:deoxyribodipyrimidine photo-lyase
MASVCRHEFKSRDDLVAYVKELSPQATNQTISQLQPSMHLIEGLLQQVSPSEYARSRNFLAGAVTHLSPFITHGLVTIQQVRDAVLAHSDASTGEKLIQQLAWRDFWQRLARQHPDWLWHNIESHKTGWQPDDYADAMPDDVVDARTPVACLNQLIQQLCETGWIHNHARLYLAAYVVHWRRVKWQVGAQWFMDLLLDGDLPSNNFSWQWVASTFSQKPYIFNLENVHKYANGVLDTAPERNREIDASYEALQQRLFPHMVEGQ